MNKINYFVVLMFILILVLDSCKKEEVSFKYTGIHINLDSINPGDIKKIDDYPFYFMNYIDDYGFDKYVTDEISTNTSSFVNYFDEKNKWACTCFAAMGAKENILFGRNFDYYHKSCMLLHTTPANAFSSYSMVDLFYCGFSENVSYQELIDNPDKLKKAPYIPFDGVNEKGVAMALMAVPSAEPPYDEGKNTLYDLALIRLVLDYAENTDHAITLLKNYNYNATDPPVHFLIADKQGNAAIVEYIEKDLKITRNTEPYIVSTNFIVYNSGAPLNVTCDRYKNAYSTLKLNSGIISQKESVELLNEVSQEITMWSLVYNLNSFHTINVALGRNYNKVYSFQKY